MARHFGKGKRTRKESFRKSQVRSFFSRNKIADNFDGRTVVVGGKDLFSKEEPDIGGTSTGGKGQETEDLQVEFVGNTIKSSKYTIWTFIPR